jgi:hypothetical protein
MKAIAIALTLIFSSLSAFVCMMGDAADLDINFNTDVDSGEPHRSYFVLHGR